MVKNENALKEKKEMMEDKLTHDERLRLECIAQTIAMGLTQPHLLTRVAEVIKDYVEKGIVIKAVKND